MSATYAHHRRRARPRKQHGRVLTLPLVAVGCAVTVALGFVVYVLWPRWPGPPMGPDAPALPITIANVAFNVPPAAIRVPMQRQPGTHERIDLNFLWPSLKPPYFASSTTTPTKGVPRPGPFDRIFVTLAVARDSTSPEERVKSIYPRYTEAEPAAGPEGLALVRFRQGTPYQGEDLIYDTTSPEHFTVRCSRNGAAATPGICLQVRRIGGADVTVRFPRDWLQDWRFVADKIGQLIASLQSPGR